MTSSTSQFAKISSFFCRIILCNLFFVCQERLLPINLDDWLISNMVVCYGVYTKKKCILGSVWVLVKASHQIYPRGLQFLSGHGVSLALCFWWERGRGGCRLYIVLHIAFVSSLFSLTIDPSPISPSSPRRTLILWSPFVRRWSLSGSLLLPVHYFRGVYRVGGELHHHLRELVLKGIPAFFLSLLTMLPPLSMIARGIPSFSCRCCCSHPCVAVVVLTKGCSWRNAFFFS